ncbi:hypothetical protein E8E12_010180 [Didymella heteroderae]|uniref:Epidermal growth factor receptor-like transmembrane-juxtamembrane segment domain-containing protein n=1 Tax=Didymella heteroderae TaxID=1769908 RepID=A0A9P4WWV1_9PLEO|nr:hypothetical protein E8E12_010180 [Didymella heteroderae]
MYSLPSPYSGFVNFNTSSDTQQPAASPSASQQQQAPPPPAPPASSSPIEQSAVVPLPTTQAAASTGLAITGSPSSPPPPPTAPASSAPLSTALIAQPVVTESVGVTNPTSFAAVPDILESTAISQALSQTTSTAGLLSQISSTAAGRPTFGPVGIIAPEQGAHSGGGGHTGDGHSSSHSSNEPNVGSIVGGVVGGLVGLALLGLLVFFLLRRRKSREGSWNEKSEESSSFVSKLKAVPAGFGGFLARLRNEKTGPLDNPYQRHQARSSIGSVYSTTSSGRGRSISEPQGQSAVGGGFVRRMSSRKSDRNVLRKKNSSVSSQTPFMGIAEEPTRNNNAGTNPFADPAPDPPRDLRISNPDTMEEQARGPSLPQPAATPRVVRDPFASLIDEIDGAPDWLRDSQMTAMTASTAPTHRRTQSSASALNSHPASSIYSRDPFADASPIPPIPTQAPTSQPQPPLSTYSAFPTTRESNYTFFGEPGPSRPGTMFTPGLPSNPGASRPPTNYFNAPITPAPLTGGPLTSTSRLDRQSDPFDLDRPEVLSFKGIMNQMRDSIARTATVRSRRTSSVGGWFGRDGSPAPALNGASVRR